MTSQLKPHEKMPEHHSTDKQPVTKEEKIDAQMADSFPPAIRLLSLAAITSSARPAGAKATPPHPAAPLWLRPRKKCKKNTATERENRVPIWCGSSMAA